MNDDVKQTANTEFWASFQDNHVQCYPVNQAQAVHTIWSGTIVIRPMPLDITQSEMLFNEGASSEWQSTDTRTSVGEQPLCYYSNFIIIITISSV